MSSTLLRYYLKRWSLPLLGALVFYGGLILVSDLVHATKEIFQEHASFRWLIPSLLTTLPYTLTMVLPMASVLGGMLGTQYLAEGSELVASQGLGVGMRSILRPWAILASIVLVLALVNSHYLVPKVADLQNKLKVQMLEEAKNRNLRPGAPPWCLKGVNGSDVSIWASLDGQIHLMETSQENIQHVIAKSMTWYRDPSAPEDATIIAFDDLTGCSVQRSTRSILHIKEQTQRIRIPNPTNAQPLPPTPLRDRPTLELIRVHSAEGWVELGLRISLPLISVALLLVGIGLGTGHPRFYKGGAVLKSLGVILIAYFFIKVCQGRVTDQFHSIIPILLLPFVFLLAGFYLLNRRLRPHHSNRFSLWRLADRTCVNPLKCYFTEKTRRLLEAWKPKGPRVEVATRSSKDALSRWTRRLWLRQWGGVMGSFLLLGLLLEFAAVAEDLSKHHASYGLFFHYWLMNLPSFLTIVFPVAFLLAGTLAMSEATQSREWVAIRAGGVSLVQWIRAGLWAWAGILTLTLLMESVIAPRMVQKADRLYRQILNRPVTTYQSKPWLYLGSKDMMWHIQGDDWWGFPLRHPAGGKPVLLHWESGNGTTEQADWDGLVFKEGPQASTLFPGGDLLGSGQIEETSTLKLMRWQKWAPDDERAAVIWSRLLNFLAGPALVFALLSFAFPGPREGRGKALAICLVGGLLFLGLQGIFMGAARTGELPAGWGVAGPLVLLAGLGLMRLNKLRT